MNCPHCLVEFHDKKEIIFLGKDSKGEWAIEKFECPNPKCKKDIYFLLNGEFHHNRNNFMYFISKDEHGFEKITSRNLIRPKGSSRPPVPIEVPEDIAKDYDEACLVLPDSPKASAALSRRALQHLLRDAADIKNGNLANEIKQVLDSNNLPSYLSESIDAIRNIGNFAAHPSKSESTGKIVEVEPGEAEWNLEVLEMLFDFYYVQPEKIKQRREALNQKLGDTGKFDMK
ncbi:uncharacterized protein DUF4145 [Gramella sp. Hel_I_59]|uniref:DUF4145 domain-containing protein n=1 Tax=Gramella sp. Hel_I_59 TaxID=1249978 RepID=UPI00116723FC|nr:DUF4145 domain-containing protein [Gramella sp. Hel_I_59]TQI71129.1 uncharacterized protein DUF4145 [Gramella sp. Hel_I_59]